MEDYKTKYPRTYHLPFSLGLQNDDKMVKEGWEKYIIGEKNEIVITEKLDGENVAISKYGAFSRSHAASTLHPWTKNIWEQNGIYEQVKTWLDEDVMIYAENLYGIHSIEYNKLSSYIFMFALREREIWKSWDDVLEMSNILELPTVPILYKGKVSSSNELENIINEIMKGKSEYGDTIEGVVVRNINEFHYNDFSKYVVKYVRKNHVQTDEHWKKNWKRAKLIYEI